VNNKLLASTLVWLSFQCFGGEACAQEGYLGLEVVGNQVVYTRRYTPAENAGLMPGDEILAINAKPVQGLGRDAIEQILRGAVGDQVTISARRGKKQFVVIMATRDPMPAAYPAGDASAEECYQLGVKQRELGRPNESRASMLRAISIDPQGLIKIRAERYILTQLPLYPVTEDALRLNNTAWNLSRSSRDEEARAIFAECIKRYPNFEWPRNNLAGIYRCAYKFAKANELIDYTLKIHPQYVSAWKERANIREAEGDVKGALACARRAVELDPEDKESLKRYAELKAEQRK
jgi:tetratricopeptide (TPR) repeat protein